jgi:hypothetical protein
MTYIILAVLSLSSLTQPDFPRYLPLLKRIASPFRAILLLFPFWVLQISASNKEVSELQKNLNGISVRRQACVTQKPHPLPAQYFAQYVAQYFQSDNKPAKGHKQDNTKQQQKQHNKKKTSKTKQSCCSHRRMF